MRGMKRIIAFLLMASITVGVISPLSEVHAETVDKETEYEAYTDADSDVLFDYYIREKGSSAEGIKAYCFNRDRSTPAVLPGSTGLYYRIIDADNETFLKYADHEEPNSDLRQNVINVVWNGYPYYGGSWKGTESQTDISITQVAVWYYTEVNSGNYDQLEKNFPHYSYVLTLVAEAEKNPAPANFALDLYDGPEATAPEAKDHQNLLAIRPVEFPPNGVSEIEITINKRWKTSQGAEYTGTTPEVTFDLYEGTIEEGEKAIQSITLPSGTNTGTFILLDDDKLYTIKERGPASDATIQFTPAPDQTIDLSQITGNTHQLEFVNTVETGGALTITKAVVGTNAPAGDKFTFEITLTEPNAQPRTETFSIAAGETKTFSGLKAGTKYAVKETLSGDYVLEGITGADIAQSDQQQASGTVTDVNNTEAIVFTNRYEPKGGLQIVKKASGEGVKDTDSFDFKVTLKNGADPYTGGYTLNGTAQTGNAAGTVEFTLVNNGTCTITDIPEGVSYEIAETKMPNNYRLSKIINGSAAIDGQDQQTATGTITKNTNIVVEFHNLRELAIVSLTVEKSVLGLPQDVTSPKFRLNVKLHNADNTPYSGTYKLSGSDTEHTYDDAAGIDLMLSDGESATILGLKEGTSYTITESEIPEGYEAVLSSVSGALDESRVEIFENKYIPPVPDDSDPTEKPEEPSKPGNQEDPQEDPSEPENQEGPREDPGEPENREDPKVDIGTPQTEDEGGVIIWMVSMVISAACLGLVAMAKRKYKAYLNDAN